MICANAPLTHQGGQDTPSAKSSRTKPSATSSRTTAAVEKCFTSRDYNEGRTAFMEKRKPVFTGT